MSTDQYKTYEAAQKLQQLLCVELNYEYVPADPDSSVGFALETRDRIPINGLRHPLKGNINGWYLWCGEEFPQGDKDFSPVHTIHLTHLQPEVLRFLGLPPGYRFLVAGEYVDVWYDESLLKV